MCFCLTESATQVAEQQQPVERQKHLGTYQLDKGICLSISRGSILDFESSQHGAIINAANESLIAGGGVDGALAKAGGTNLAKDRHNVPNSDGVRCKTGQAVLTGPGNYDMLKVPYVIHAVGPNYESCEGDFDEPNQLLKSAYRSSLECCRSNKEIKDIAFSLISSGIFRGKQSRRKILHLAVQSIRDWVSESEDCGSIQTITLFAYKIIEADLLVDICNQELNPCT